MLITNCDCSDLLQSERLTVQLHLRSLVEKNSLGRELLTDPDDFSLVTSKCAGLYFCAG